MGTIAEVRRENARKLMKELGGQDEVIKRTGRSQSQISQIMGDVSKPKSIGDSLARKLEQELDKPRGWLDSIQKEESDPNRIEIPFFNAFASMGSGAEPPSYEAVVAMITVSKSFIRSNLSVTNYDNLGLLTAYGDSMKGTFNDGDILLVDRGVIDVRIDAVYVMCRDGELYIKRLQRHPIDGSIEVISDNSKKYKPFTIKREELGELTILGRVLLAWNMQKL